MNIFYPSLWLRLVQMALLVLGIYCLLLAGTFHLMELRSLTFGYLCIAAGLGAGASLLQLHFHRSENVLTLEVARILFPFGIVLSFAAALYFSHHIQDISPLVRREGEIFKLASMLLAGVFAFRLTDLHWLPTLHEEADCVAAADRIRARRANTPETISAPRGSHGMAGTTHSETDTAFPLRLRVHHDERLSAGTFYAGATLEIRAKTPAAKIAPHTRHFFAVVDPDTALQTDWPRQLARLRRGSTEATGAVEQIAEQNPKVREDALHAISTLNLLLHEAEDLSGNEAQQRQACLEQLHRAALHISRKLFLAGLRKGIPEIHEFLAWSRHYCGSELVSILVNEDAHFASAFEQARSLENVLRDTPTSSTQIRLDHEGYWKIVAFTLTNGEWHAAARGFRVVRPIRVPAGADLRNAPLSENTVPYPA